MKSLNFLRVNKVDTKVSHDKNDLSIMHTLNNEFSSCVSLPVYNASFILISVCVNNKIIQLRVLYSVNA
jgi:hypothetical protein